MVVKQIQWWPYVNQIVWCKNWNKCEYMGMWSSDKKKTWVCDLIKRLKFGSYDTQIHQMGNVSDASFFFFNVISISPVCPWHFLALPMSHPGIIVWISKGRLHTHQHLAFSKIMYNIILMVMEFWNLMKGRDDWVTNWKEVLRLQSPGGKNYED